MQNENVETIRINRGNEEPVSKNRRSEIETY